MSGRPLPLRGEVFGDLTVEIPIAKTQRGVLWSCRCACGRLALRTAKALRRAKQLKQHSACGECNRSLYKWRFADARRSRQDILRDVWAERGTLWTNAANDYLRLGVQEDLEKEFGALPEELYLGAHTIAEPEPTRPPARLQQRVVYLYPISIEPDEGCWECVNCKEWFSRGLGCVACVEPVCRECVRAEAHKCEESAEYGHDAGMPLSRIGKDLEVTRARSHQIVAKALRKLRHPSVARFLRPFLPTPSK